MGIIVTLTGSYLGMTFPGLMDIAPFIVILIVLLFRPHGLFGEVRIERI